MLGVGIVSLNQYLYIYLRALESFFFLFIRMISDDTLDDPGITMSSFRT